MSRLIQFVCLNDDCNASCVSYPDMVPLCNSCQNNMVSVPALKAENERLTSLVTHVNDIAFTYRREHDALFSIADITYLNKTDGE